MTSLAAQLQAVASAVPREEKLKGKASLLYDIREAADIDLATIYAVGVQGASPRPPAGEALPPPPLYARRHIPRMARSTRRRRRSRREPVLARRRALDVPWHARARAASLERPGARSRARRPDASRTASVSPCRVSSSLTRRVPHKTIASFASFAANSRRARAVSRRFHRAVSVGRPVRGVPEAAVLARRVRDEPRAAGQGVQRPIERHDRGVFAIALRALRDRRGGAVPGVPPPAVQNTRLQRRSRGDVRVAVPRHRRVRQARAARQPGEHVLLLAEGRQGEGRRSAARRARRAVRAGRRFPQLRVRSRSRERQRQGTVRRVFSFVFFSFFVVVRVRWVSSHRTAERLTERRRKENVFFSFFSKTFSSRVARPVHRLFFRLMRGRTRALKPHASLRPAARWKSTLRDEKACRRPVPRSQRTAQTVMDGGA